MGLLEGKVAVVTGGTSGIGKATVDLFSKEGAKVVEVSHNGQYTCDVADEENVAKAVESIAHDFGRIDILVNNAGAFYSAPLHQTQPEDWDAMFHANPRSAYLMSKAILPYMITESRGSIVHIASVLGELGSYANAAYSAAKGAMISMTRSMAVDYAGYGIRVNCVSPSIIDTPKTKDIPEDIKQRIIDEHLIKRIGKPEDVANAVLFLASDMSGWITGENIRVDGGISVR